MSQKLQPVRGTQDLLSKISRQFRFIDRIAYETAELYGYEEIETPIFEFSEVFHRTLGESSDAVAKETYTFTDRGGEEITLRPEGTAGIARAFISNGLAQNLPLKLYYSGPMFRYERPQKGRYRQFHQIGVECLGLESPIADVECLALAQQIFSSLGLVEKVQLEINSLGDHESRTKHRSLLVEYLKDFESKLSEDSKVRLQKNPLRILDSKDDGDQKILIGAPLLKNCLNEFSQQFYSEVLGGLKTLGISYVQNDRLVRGLDYYTHTVFEFTTTHLGAQSAVLAGGRYDGLIETMGGPKTPGVGWAAGMERLALLLDSNSIKNSLPLSVIVSADDKAEDFCLKLAYDLRSAGFAAELSQGGNVGKKLKRANKLGARFALIVGETELQQNSVTLKDLTSGTQTLVPSSQLAEHLKR
jgi:histidyl-tRNA synthetase